MAGRPRKPTKVLEMQGTAQPCRMEKRRGELEVEGDFPNPPEWITGAALTEWNRVQAISTYAQCIKESDRSILAAYCQMYGQLQENGDLSATKWVVFISLAGKLGMTPADRSKVTVGSSRKEENPFSKFGTRA